MAAGLWLYVNVDGVPDKERLPLTSSTLKRTKCRRPLTLRRAKGYRWVQIDGFSPEEAESYAPRISEDFQTDVLLFEFASASRSLRYVKWKYQGKNGSQEVTRWAYNVESTGWEICQGSEADLEFGLILPPGNGGTRRKASQGPKNARLIRPAKDLGTPDLLELGTLLKLPGLAPGTDRWTEELQYEPAEYQSPRDLFELFRRGNWDTDDVKRLIAEGADVNRTLGEVDPTVFAELRGTTPLEAALDALMSVQATVAFTVKVLLEAGADPNRLGTLYTPLYTAIDNDATNLTILSLLKGGATVDRNHSREDTVNLKDLLKRCNRAGVKFAIEEKAKSEGTPPKKLVKGAPKKKPGRRS